MQFFPLQILTSTAKKKKNETMNTSTRIQSQTRVFSLLTKHVAILTAYNHKQNLMFPYSCIMWYGADCVDTIKTTKAELNTVKYFSTIYCTMGWGWSTVHNTTYIPMSGAIWHYLLNYLVEGIQSYSPERLTVNVLLLQHIGYTLCPILPITSFTTPRRVKERRKTCM